VRKLLFGDDWPLAVASLLALALTALLHELGLAAWWLAPAAVALALTASVRHAVKAHTRPTLTTIERRFK
jgi:hypothetical protein